MIEHEGPGTPAVETAVRSTRLVIACAWREGTRTIYERAPVPEHRRFYGRTLRRGVKVGSKVFVGRTYVEEHRLSTGPLIRSDRATAGRPEKPRRDRFRLAPAHVWIVGSERVYEPAGHLGEVLTTGNGTAVRAGLRYDGRLYFGRLKVPAHLIRDRKAAVLVLPETHGGAKSPKISSGGRTYLGADQRRFPCAANRRTP